MGELTRLALVPGPEHGSPAERYCAVSSRSGAVVFALLSMLLTALDLGIFLAGRWLNELRPEFLFWVVAEYAQPWASIGLASAVALGVFGLYRVIRASQLGFAARLGFGALSFVVSVLLALELSAAISFEYTLGEFDIGGAVFTRTSLRFPHNADGVCLHADLSGFFTWHLNGIAVHPRLLPLPLDAAELMTQLATAHCGDPQ